MTVIFESFTLDQDRRELWCDDALVAMQPQVFDLLVYVIENHDRVVTRGDLIENIWKGRIVSESTLATRINAARNALGDNGTDQRLIRTIHGKGIRFVGILKSDNSAAAVQPQRKINEKANLYLSEFSGDASGSIADELQDKLVSGIAGEPLYALIPEAPPEKGAIMGYHLTGVFRQAGDQDQLSVKLSKLDTSSLIWAEQFDIPRTNYTEALSRIADKIIGRTYADLHRDRSSHARAIDIDQSSATDLYYKSRSLIRTKIPADNFAAEKLVHRSITMAPELFGGHMGLAVLYLVRTTSVWSKDVLGDLEIGRQAANAAAGVDENSIGPPQMLAFYSAYKRQFSAAMEYIADCEKLGSTRASAKGLRGVMLSYQGQFDEALAFLESAQRSDADQRKNYALNIGRTHFMSGDFDLAIPKLEKFVGQYPAGDLALLFLGNCYDGTDQPDKARACVATQISLCPFTTIERISHVTPYTEEVLRTFRAFLRKYGVPEN